MEINVITYWFHNWGAEYGPLYVLRLYESLKKFSTVDFNFLCFTDNPNILKVPTVSFKPEFVWNLNKFIHFNPKYGLTGKSLVLDLDLFIVSNIDDILTFEEEAITWDDVYRPGRPSGSVNGMTVEIGRKLWKSLDEDGDRIAKKTMGGREKFFLRDNLPNISFWQDKYSGIYSYKKECIPTCPRDSRIIIFHGNPRPHNIKRIREDVLIQGRSPFEDGEN